MQALLAAVWQWTPKAKMMVYSVQRSQFASRVCHSYLRHHNLEAGISHRGNCQKNVVAETFFRRLKRKRIRRRTYLTLDAASEDVLEYIEMFYNPKRVYTNKHMPSPIHFEHRQRKLNEADVWEIRAPLSRP